MNQANKSQNLAERLRGLYQIYGCEQELPGHEDLVAKISSAKQYVRNIFRQELDLGLVSPISYEEALLVAGDSSLFEKLMISYELIRRAGIIGALAIPSLLSKEEVAKGYMDGHNVLAKRYFSIFKDEVKYDLDNCDNK